MGCLSVVGHGLYIKLSSLLGTQSTPHIRSRRWQYGLPRSHLHRIATLMFMVRALMKTKPLFIIVSATIASGVFVISGRDLYCIPELVVEDVADIESIKAIKCLNRGLEG